MDQGQLKPLSWWCGLDRATLHREIDARLELWQRQKIGLLDTVGPRIRDEWEPRRPHSTRREPIA